MAGYEFILATASNEGSLSCWTLESLITWELGTFQLYSLIPGFGRKYHCGCVIGYSARLHAGLHQRALDVDGRFAVIKTNWQGNSTTMSGYLDGHILGEVTAYSAHRVSSDLSEI